MTDLFFWTCHHDYENGYNNEKKGKVENLDVIMQLQERYQEKSAYAVFKQGIEPRQEAEENRITMTHPFSAGNCNIAEFLKVFWKTQIFNKDSVNGIYWNKKKVSVWVNRPDTIEAFEQLELLILCKKIKHIPDDAILGRKWSIGFFSRHAFKIKSEFIKWPDECISTNSVQKLSRWIEKHYHLRNDGNGLLLTPNILEEKEWRVPHYKNRFVSSSIQIGLKESNKIWKQFALDLTKNIFSRVPPIYLAYVYYCDGIFEIGVYLTGKEIAVDENGIDQQGDKNATDVGNTLKKVILANLACEETLVEINVTNAIPSEDADFHNLKCVYSQFL